MQVLQADVQAWAGCSGHTTAKSDVRGSILVDEAISATVVANVGGCTSNITDGIAANVDVVSASRVVEMCTIKIRISLVFGNLLVDGCFQILKIHWVLQIHQADLAQILSSDNVWASCKLQIQKSSLLWHCESNTWVRSAELHFINDLF